MAQFYCARALFYALLQIDSMREFYESIVGKSYLESYLGQIDTRNFKINICTIKLCTHTLKIVSVAFVVFGILAADFAIQEISTNSKIEALEENFKKSFPESTAEQRLNHYIDLADIRNEAFSKPYGHGLLEKVNGEFPDKEK